MKTPFDKYEAIQLAETLAYKEQAKFTALGYKSFMLMVAFEDLSTQGWYGYHYRDSSLIVLGIDHWQTATAEQIQDTIVHEMVHMYVDNFHYEDAVYMHGPEFATLYEQVTGKPYVHYDMLHSVVDKYRVLTEQEKLAREVANKLGMF